jgi:hypothetical protein
VQPGLLECRLYSLVFLSALSSGVSCERVNKRPRRQGCESNRSLVVEDTNAKITG